MTPDLPSGFPPPDPQPTVLRDIFVSATVVAAVAGGLWLAFAATDPHGVLIGGLTWAIAGLAIAIGIVRAVKIAQDMALDRLRAMIGPEPQVAAGPTPDAAFIAAAPTTGEQMFDQWVRHRIIYSTGDSVVASAALDDYNRMCMGNGVQPVTQVKFGQLMTAWANASGGRVSKSKSDGVMVYRGVRLAND